MAKDQTCSKLPVSGLTSRQRLVGYLAWTVALGGMLMSLYFSEVLKLTPCNLCWYQRIALYPLTLIIPIGLVRKDQKLSGYVLALSLVGLLVAIYQNLLYYGIIPESAAPCSLGVSCIAKQLEWFGFLTIPMMSGLSFGLITGLMIIFHQEAKHEPRY